MQTLEKWEEIKLGRRVFTTNEELDQLIEHFKDQDSPDADLYFSRCVSAAVDGGYEAFLAAPAAVPEILDETDVTEKSTIGGTQIAIAKELLSVSWSGERGGGSLFHILQAGLSNTGSRSAAAGPAAPAVGSARASRPCSYHSDSGLYARH